MTQASPLAAEAFSGTRAGDLPNSMPDREAISEKVAGRNHSSQRGRTRIEPGVSVVQDVPADRDVPEAQTPLQASAPGDLEVASLKKEEDWFIGVNSSDGNTYYFRNDDLATSLRTEIVDGRFQRDSEVVVYAKTPEGDWNQISTTLQEFSTNHFELRVLYEPVWSYAMAGLKWGAITGILLKLADTFFLLAAVDPGMALLFAVAIGVCIIPRIGWIGVGVVAFATARYTGANFFLMGISAAIIGATLGSLPGMAVGGAMGMLRRKSLPRAKDSSEERGSISIQAILLPLAAGAALIAFYIFVFNPWLVTLLG